MKPKILCALGLAILLLAVACAPKPSSIIPLTETERLAIRDGQAAVNQAQRLAQQSREAVALQNAQNAFVQTKEYKTFTVAQQAVNATKQASELNVATAAAQQAKETVAFTKAQENLNAAVDEIFKSRHVEKADYIICDGPAELQAACKDVGAAEIALRALKK